MSRHKSVHETSVLKRALDYRTSDGIWLGTEGRWGAPNEAWPLM